MVVVRALLAHVPLDDDGRDVVAVIAAAICPALPTGLHQEAGCLPRPLEPQLLGREVESLVVLDELPDAVRRDDGVVLVGGLQQDLLVLGLLQDARARGVAEGTGHGEAGEGGASDVDAVAALVHLADLGARGLEARALLGDLGLVVLGAVDQAGVVSVPRCDHGSCVADVRHVDPRPIEDEHGARGPGGLHVHVVLLAQTQQILLRLEECFSQGRLPILPKLLALHQIMREGLDQAEGDQVTKGPVAIGHTIDLHGSDVQDEVVVLIWRRIRCGLLPLLAQHRYVSGSLQPRRRFPSVDVLYTLGRWSGLRRDDNRLVQRELFAQPQAAESLDESLRDGELGAHVDEGGVLEVLGDLVLQADSPLVGCRLALSTRLDEDRPVALAPHDLLLHLRRTVEHLRAPGEARGPARVVDGGPALALLARPRGGIDGLLVVLVLADVALQEVAQWTEDAIEGVAGDVQARDRTHGVDTGLAWLSQQKCDFTKVVSLIVLLDLDLALVSFDACDGLPLADDKHVVVLVALLENGLVLLEVLLEQNLRQGGQLLCVQLGEDVAPLQEGHVLPEALLRSFHDEHPEGHSLQAPDLGLRRRGDRGRPRRVVEQGQLPEGEARARLEDLHPALRGPFLEDVEVAALHDVEIVPDISLRDDVLAPGDGLQEHGVDDLFEGLRGHVPEHHLQLRVLRGPHDVAELLPLPGRLLVHRRRPAGAAALPSLRANAAAAHGRLPHDVDLLHFVTFAPRVVVSVRACGFRWRHWRRRLLD
mmetsp:Transcript_126258/g.315660  ORF Transcript_126258/g.315660 Transcript_126258/m.315660 type:complete len:763 (+) Transcript_126258:46-2334(+)